MRGGWIAGVVELCVYLFGFTLTGALIARQPPGPGDHPGDKVIAVVAGAFFWPLLAIVCAAGYGVRGLAWLLGVRQD